MPDAAHQIAEVPLALPTKEDEHITVRDKGARRCTVLLDDSTLVKLLPRYLRDPGYQHGPFFRA